MIGRFRESKEISIRERSELDNFDFNCQQIWKVKNLFEAGEDIPGVGPDAKRQAIEPLFFIKVHINPVEVDPSRIEYKEIGLQITNAEDFDLMTVE